MEHLQADASDPEDGIPNFAQEPPRQPSVWLRQWIEEAAHAGEGEPTAMALASTGAQGPAVRFVLCKEVNERGVCFFTNLDSVKGQQLRARPEAAIAFHWPIVGRQVRIEGRVEPVAVEDADAYYQTRSRLSRLGAWASQQSRPLAERQQLLDAVETFDAKYPSDDIPRPPHWSGFQLVASRWEFWQQCPGRLHQRWTLAMGQDGWRAWQLFP